MAAHEVSLPLSPYEVANSYLLNLSLAHQREREEPRFHNIKLTFFLVS